MQPTRIHLPDEQRTIGFSFAEKLQPGDSLVG
jgi:hypothetical protein